MLVEGELGGNLLSKYSMVGRFIVLDESLDFLQLALRDVIDVNANPEAEAMIAAVVGYYRSIMLHTPFVQSVDDNPHWQTLYDIENWRRSDFKRPLSAFRFPQLKEYSTRVEKKTRSTILSRISTFGEHPQGLGRFTRTMFAQDLRRNVYPD
jgi:hypothetical protein